MQVIVSTWLVSNCTIKYKAFWGYWNSSHCFHPNEIFPRTHLRSSLVIELSLFLVKLLFSKENMCFAFRLALSHSFNFYENTNTTHQPFTGFSPIFQGHFFGPWTCACASPVMKSYIWPDTAQSDLPLPWRGFGKQSLPGSRTAPGDVAEVVSKEKAKNRNTLLQQGVVKAHPNLRYQRNSKQLHLGFLASTERLMPQNPSSRTRI